MELFDLIITDQMPTGDKITHTAINESNTQALRLSRSILI